LSRLRILALFAALIALTATLAACGSGGGSDDPQQVVDEATLQGIESGQLDLSVGIKSEGQKSGNVDVSVSGPFQSEDGGQPELALLAKASGTAGGEDIDREGGLTLLGNRAFVNYEGTEYAVDPTTFGFVKSMIQSQAGGQGQSQEGTACQGVVGKLEVGDFIDNLHSAGDADVDGTSTTKVSGDLNPAGAVESVTKIVEDPACSEQLKAAGPLPSVAELDDAKSEVQQSVKATHVDLYVGDDHIVRRISAQATIEPPKRSSRGARKLELDLDLELTGVNEDQEIPVPQAAKPLSSLFLKLGINPIELLGAFRGQGGLSSGLGALLDKIGGADGGSSGGQQSYYECLQGATSPVELQNCAGLLQ
jgi:hypothetical protein